MLQLSNERMPQSSQRLRENEQKPCHEERHWDKCRNCQPNPARPSSSLNMERVVAGMPGRADPQFAHGQNARADSEPDERVHSNRGDWNQLHQPLVRAVELLASERL